MRAILNHAGIRWEPTQMGIVHGILGVPDPGKFGIMPGTAAALGDIVDSCHAMGGSSRTSHAIMAYRAVRPLIARRRS